MGNSLSPRKALPMHGCKSLGVEWCLKKFAIKKWFVCLLLRIKKFFIRSCIDFSTHLYKKIVEFPPIFFIQIFIVCFQYFYNPVINISIIFNILILVSMRSINVNNCEDHWTEKTMELQFISWEDGSTIIHDIININFIYY